MTQRMPTLFLGHGNPLNALADNAFTRGWTALGKALPRPRAILVVSAHWYVPGIAVTAMPQPRTIHDFGGFPQALFDIRYPAPGDAALAGQVQGLLAPQPVVLDQQWGLDHGTWSVLIHLFPEADIPVVQLSMDDRQPAAFHLALAEQLRPLRDEGVLIVGSGNIVHNLGRYAWQQPDTPMFDWGQRFEEQVRAALLREDHGALADYARFGDDALLAVPTPEHYLPLLYVLGASLPGEPVRFPVTGSEGGALSMLSVQKG
ncbi:4,5-DOPA dioxygenase extradiol [Alcanivorax sp. JB21]|uniref:4,5-DOPA-extradiol-dioxygenase n=1 Tax=Alcanivorax limicola TaxID=2874102 RepID=UPI001CBB247F|nr:4,5-DOPA dioxygenase extradiol [Alcanivorax limicola]MBZ2189043.1 4,5-DOPA dioxygenase extradiol [Alcanivorax limicola]